jgi:hypothetical protein
MKPRDERPKWPAVNGRDQGRAAGRGRCGSYRHALRAEALRRAELPRPVAPVTGRMRCPPYLPVPRPMKRLLRVHNGQECRARREQLQAQSGQVIEVLTYLRRRPWLSPCLLLISIGLSTLVFRQHGYLLTWAGILVIAGGLLGILSGELGYRRERASRAGDQSHPGVDDHMPGSGADNAH